MVQLLNANFARLFKSKLFRICAGAILVLALIEAIVNGVDSRPRWMPLYPEITLFSTSGVFLLFTSAVLVGSFVGSEHGGALRNKIITGQKRSSIFLANTITCSAAVAILHLVFLATVLLAGVFGGGEYLLSFGEIALYELLQLTSLIEAGVIFSVVSLLIPHKFSGAVCSLVISLFLFGINSFMPSLLMQKKYTDMSYFKGYPMCLVDKTGISEENQTQIRILETIQDITPFGQQTQIQDSFYNAFYHEYFIILDEHFPETDIGYTKIPIPVETALFSLGTAAAATFIGTLVFRKKDLRRKNVTAFKREFRQAF